MTRGSRPVNVVSSAPATVTPRLIASICTSENRLLPLLAPPVPRSFSVSVFIAVNCIEFTPPKSASCTSRSHSGWSAVVSPKLAIARPTSTVFVNNTRR